MACEFLILSQTKMRAYGSKSFGSPRRSGGKWKRWFLVFVFGFVGGFVVATAFSVREPIQLEISTPLPPETVEEDPEEQIWSASGNISVSTPKPNTVVSSPLIVEGLERTFEQNVVVRLKDAGDRELAKVAVTGTAPDAGIHGPYRAELTFETPATKTGTLEVFQGSPKDGSEIDKVTIPVRFE